ncbi:MAG: UDP-3-O-(3-hydroxymyristoyl)glucosamine N-acyltransferase, partial [Chlamydiales bacterium]|nr:UDP-3-O-(3-hydroxymyristoyl)glucosamine N-acyltransferase [Chlamydiales bacterium]
MAKQFTAAELANITQSALVGAKNHLLFDIDDLENAGSSDVSFLANPRYEDMMRSSQAGLICIDKKTKLTEGKNYLVSDNPSSCFQQIAELFYQDKLKKSSLSGIHSAAVIASNVKIGKNVTIGPCTTIDSGCSI